MHVDAGQRVGQLQADSAPGAVDQDTFRKVVENGASSLGEKAKEVSGVGDQAFSLVGILIVQKGNYLMQVSVTDTQLDESALLDKSKEVARKALGRLP